MKIKISKHAKERSKERLGSEHDASIVCTPYAKWIISMFSGNCILLHNKVKYVIVNYTLVTVVKIDYFVDLNKRKKKQFRRKS